MDNNEESLASLAYKFWKQKLSKKTANDVTIEVLKHPKLFASNDETSKQKMNKVK